MEKFTTYEELVHGWNKFRAELEGDGYETSPEEFVWVSYESDQLHSKAIAARFMQDHGVSEEASTKVLREMDEQVPDLFQQEIMEWCVNYVRQVIVNEHDGFLIGRMMDDTSASEWEILSALEMLSPEVDE